MHNKAICHLHLGKSLVKRKNSKGLNIEPYGTLKSINSILMVWSNMNCSVFQYDIII